MDLSQVVTPAIEEETSWFGRGLFTLSDGDTFKIESDEVEHVLHEVPVGEDHEFEIILKIRKL